MLEIIASKYKNLRGGTILIVKTSKFSGKKIKLDSGVKNLIAFPENVKSVKWTKESDSFPIFKGGINSAKNGPSFLTGDSTLNTNILYSRENSCSGHSSLSFVGILLGWKKVKREIISHPSKTMLKNSFFGNPVMLIIIAFYCLTNGYNF